MGIVLGALGGFGAAIQSAGASMQQSDQDLAVRSQLQAQESDLAVQRAKALEDYKVAAANQQREAQASRIDTAAQPILQQGIISKATNARATQLPEYDPNAASNVTGDTDTSDSSISSAPASFHGNAQEVLAAINQLPDGPDKQAALAQLRQNVAANKANVGQLTSDDLTGAEKSQFAPTQDDIIRARTRAAIQTGDISPAEAAKLQQGADIGQAKLEAAEKLADIRGQYMTQAWEARSEAYAARTQAQYDAAMAKLQATIDKAGGGNTDFDKKVKLLKDAGAKPKDIANFILERKQPSLEDLANGFLKADPNAGSKGAMTPQQAMDKARTLRSLTTTLDSAAPAASAASAASSASGPKVLQFDPTTGTFH